ncbi:MAG: hypothetical protein PHE33_07650 [Bacteroidales bacterium]|nr:hypothetical protein [Bacteroidales bacterium]
MAYRIIFVLVILGFLSNSCKDNEEAKPDLNIVAEVNGEYLYKKDLVKILYKNISPEDSAKLVSNYIHSWLGEKLMYSEARRVLTDTASIENKIKNYRQQLYLYYYSERYIYNDVDYKLSEEEIEGYYTKHLQDYVLAKTYVKAHYMTMDAEVSTYYLERDRLFNSNLEDKEELLDFCVGTGRKVYFFEEWTELGEFLDEVKCLDSFDANELLFKSTLENVSNNLRYLIKFDDYKTLGDYMPLEIAREKIAEILINHKKKEKYLQKQNQLIEQGVKSGSVVIKQ